MKNLKTASLSKLILTLWLFTLTVILWGAWVRISHSGDGCGNHWPLCKGVLLPSFEDKKTWIELTHRIMSGLYGVVVIFVFFVVRKSIHQSQRLLGWALLIFMISEALLGALLVKAELVSVNDSIVRLFVMCLHQINSFMLTGITYALYLSINSPQLNFPKINLKYLILFITLPLTGAVAALSTTLFPAQSLWEGLLQDISSNPHIFIRLRLSHPLLAASLCIFFIVFSYLKGCNKLAFEFLTATCIGIITLITLSPVYLKLTHLFLAHYIWARLIYTLVSLPDSKSR